MNVSIIIKLQSFILGVLSIAFAASLGVALFMDNHSSSDLSVPGFTLCLIVTLSLATGCWFLSRSGSHTLYHREALVTIGAGWVVASLVGAMPYILILPDLSLASAFFESASGLTTTGASVLSDLEQLPRSLLFWRAISQWIGGLGVVVFFVAILSFLGAGAKVLFSRESSAEAGDLSTARVQQGVKQILYLYLCLSLACIGAYLLCGLSPYEAVIHMFTTLSTGGFSTRTGSLGDFANPALEWTAILFMTLGGTSFLFILEITRRRWRATRSFSEVKAYYLILGISTLVITGFLVFSRGTEVHSLADTFRSAAFHVVSIMTTTGFATEDFDLWLPVTHMLLLALMFVGGCSGSTAGGTKVIRFLIALKVSLQSVEKAYRVRVVRALRVNGKYLSRDDQENMMTYIVLLGLVVFCGTLLLALMEPGMSFEGTVSAMAACLFNIGPGLAEVGPTSNFAGLHDLTQIFLALLMIMGRLELFAILVLFSPSLWKQF